LEVVPTKETRKRIIRVAGRRRAIDNEVVQKRDSRYKCIRGRISQDGRRGIRLSENMDAVLVLMYP
jgi:hypothetical protein